MQGVKRPLNAITPDMVQPSKQPYAPRPFRPPFPPRGTAPRPMRSNTATSHPTYYEDEVDYNDIRALRAYVARSQEYAYTQEYVEDLTQQELQSNPQDADWDPEEQL